MSELHVWMNGQPVAVWSQGRTGASRLSYLREWAESPRARSLSLSLQIPPGLTLTGPVVDHYFDNLLPDNDGIRERLKRRFGAGSLRPFDLLTAIGRDCVGAVQLLPPGHEPIGFDRLDYRRLKEDDIARLLRGVASDRGLGAQAADDDEFRISIAGAQEKTALLRVGRTWCAPHGATPTTHILKLPLGIIGGGLDMTHSVENEWLCGRLLAALGLPVAASEMASFGDQRVLVVERFDRAWQDGRRWIARLPQEDFCQATGRAPERKYESHGGPGMLACLQLLSASEAPDIDRGSFVLAQLAFWMLAATDGHAKNFSIFLQRGDAYALTPLYDVLSAWPVIGHGDRKIAWQKAKLAMAVPGKNRHYNLASIQPRHWTDLAVRTGVPDLRAAMREMAEAVPRAIAEVEAGLPADFPPRVFEAITQGLARQARAFLKPAGAALPTS